MKKKYLIVLIVFALITLFAFANVFGSEIFIDKSVSDEWKARGTDEDNLFGTGATEHLYNVVVDDFEEGSLWSCQMSPDQGIVKSRGFNGGPRPLRSYGVPNALYGPPEFVAKMVERDADGNISGIKSDATIDNSEKTIPRYRRADGFLSGLNEYRVRPYGDEHKGILGVKVSFMRRGFSWFAVKPPKPTYLQGIVKSFDAWVCGRNKQHTMYIIVEDIYGKDRMIQLGKLNFLGWKRLVVQVPHDIPQEDFNMPRKRGLYFKGFYIQCNPLEAYGEYFVYFDNVSAELSRYFEETFDPFDPVDNW